MSRDVVPASIDLLIAGSGMAGMTAGASAAARGRRVVVVEKASEIGGNAALSGGWVWTAKDPEVLITQSPSADPELIETLCADYQRLMDWIRSTGTPVGNEAVVLEYGRGSDVDMPAYFEACRNLIEQAGGTILTRAQLYALVTDATGAVIGGDVLSSGADVRLTAAWTLLSTGGFQADTELITEHIHPQAPSMPLRSNRASTGDALRAATAVGAATWPSMDGFYGHLVSWPTDTWVPGVFARLSQYHSHRAALVNVAGELFRPPFENDHYNTADSTGGRKHLGEFF